MIAKHTHILFLKGFPTHSPYRQVVYAIVRRWRRRTRRRRQERQCKEIKLNLCKQYQQHPVCAVGGAGDRKIISKQVQT